MASFKPGLLTSQNSCEMGTVELTLKSNVFSLWSFALIVEVFSGLVIDDVGEVPVGLDEQCKLP